MDQGIVGDQVLVERVRVGQIYLEEAERGRSTCFAIFKQRRQVDFLETSSDDDIELFQREEVLIGRQYGISQAFQEVNMKCMAAFSSVGRSCRKKSKIVKGRKQA